MNRMRRVRLLLQPLLLLNTSNHNNSNSSNKERLSLLEEWSCLEWEP